MRRFDIAVGEDPLVEGEDERALAAVCFLRRYTHVHRTKLLITVIVVAVGSRK